MSICLCHGDICELSIGCSLPAISHPLQSPPPRDLLEFSFRRGGGTPPPWTPSPPPLDPLPPSPLSSSAAENLGFGNFFW